MSLNESYKIWSLSTFLIVSFGEWGRRSSGGDNVFIQKLLIKIKKNDALELILPQNYCRHGFNEDKILRFGYMIVIFSNVRPNSLMA